MKCESKKEKEEKKRRKDNTLHSRPLTDDIHNDATSAPNTAEGSVTGTSKKMALALTRRKLVDSPEGFLETKTNHEEK